MLNYNDLPSEIREGWLPENDVNIQYINKPNMKTKVKIYDNIAKNKDNEEEEININENQEENKIKKKKRSSKKKRNI